VAAVARVLLDHVDHDPPQRGAPSGDALPRRIGRRLGVHRHAGGRSAGELDLGLQRGERVGHRVGGRRVEVAVGVAPVGLVAAVEERRLLVGEASAEPTALHLRHVPSEAQQRQLRRRQGEPHLRLVEAFHLADEHAAVVLEERVERGRLVGGVQQLGIGRQFGHGPTLASRLLAAPQLRFG
jgi:hypothetical protein